MDAFEKIKGYKEIKTELLRINDILCNYEKYEKLGVKMPAGLLLYGDPGVGKTTMAKSLIEASGRKAFICRKNKPDGEFVTEIVELFADAVQNAPSIVLLDDLDKFANGNGKNRDEEEYVTVQSCIDEVKGADVFVIATANYIDNLPGSLRRAGRLDKTICVSGPREQEAEEIIRYYLSQKSYIDEIDAKEIAKMLNGRSCAVLESVINEAGIYAGFDDRDKICMNDILKAVLRIVYDAPECKEPLNTHIEKIVACHEAGHAIVSEILSPGSVGLVTVKKNTGKTGGFTTNCNPEDFWFSKKEMENRVISVLAGKAASELMFGVADVGCNSDLHRAFDLVERFIDNYCAYGFDTWAQSSSKSDALMARRESFMSAEMNRYLEEARRLIMDNWDYLNRVMNVLIDEKFITGARVRELKETA